MYLGKVAGRISRPDRSDIMVLNKVARDILSCCLLWQIQGRWVADLFRKLEMFEW